MVRNHREGDLQITFQPAAILVRTNLEEQQPALVAERMKPWSLHLESLEEDFVLEQALIQMVRNQKELDHQITFQLLAPVVHTRFELMAGMRQPRVAVIADTQNWGRSEANRARLPSLLVALERILGKDSVQKAQNQEVLDLQITFQPDSILVHTYSELLVRIQNPALVTEMMEPWDLHLGLPVHQMEAEMMEQGVALGLPVHRTEMMKPWDLHLGILEKSLVLPRPVHTSSELVVVEMHKSFQVEMHKSSQMPVTVALFVAVGKVQSHQEQDLRIAFQPFLLPVHTRFGCLVGMQQLADMAVKVEIQTVLLLSLKRQFDLYYLTGMVQKRSELGLQTAFLFASIPYVRGALVRELLVVALPVSFPDMPAASV
jgi:hypothetical protein